MNFPSLSIVIFIVSVFVVPVPGNDESVANSREQNNPTSPLITIDEPESESSSKYDEGLPLVGSNENATGITLKSNVNNGTSSINNTELMEIAEDNKNSTIMKLNTSLAEPNRSDAVYKIYSNCLTDKVYGVVEVVNATRLMELLIIDPASTNKGENKKDSKLSPRTCLLVLFYSRWCVFSSQAAPHFNALPRFFPHIKIVAIDASKYQNFNTQFGIVGVPTLMFVYNGKPLVKFNDTSYTLESFARFVTEYTALKPNGSLYVTSADFSGPVPSTPSNETDYCLVLSWAFIAACAIYFTLQSQWWKQFVELVQNTWRESNAQHEHTD